MSMCHTMLPLFFETREHLPVREIGGKAGACESSREVVGLPLKKPGLVRMHNHGLPAEGMMRRTLDSKISVLADARARVAGVSLAYPFGQDLHGTHDSLKRAFDSGIHEAPDVSSVTNCERLAKNGASTFRIVNEVEGRRRNAGSEPG